MAAAGDPFLTFRTIFPRQLPAIATRVLHVTRQLRAFEHFTLEHQDALIAGQLNHLLSHSKERSLYWAERLADWRPGGRTPAEALAGVPVLTRADLQNHREQLVVDFPERKALGTYRNKSSGSTGLPVSFQLAPGLFGPLYHAVTMVAAEWHGFDPKKPLGVLGSTQVDKPQANLSVPFSWFGPTAVGFGYSTKDREIGELFELCVRGRPTYLLCGPQVLRRLASYAIQHRRSDLRIERALTFGSAVTDEIRDVVREGLGGEIMDRYSSEENGYIALQCPKHRHYHAISAVTYVEIVDRHGKPSAVGEPGRVLLTSTQSYAMPFIRYDIGDMAEWGPSCDCGIALPVIKKLWGRMKQNIVTPDGRETFARIYARDFADIPGLLEYRFVLHANAVVVAQVKLAPQSPPVDAAITERVQRALSYAYPVRVRYVDTIDWGTSWKQENFSVSDSPAPS